MLVCPLGVSLFIFCKIILVKQDFRQKDCSNEGLLNFKHLECCEVEKKFISDHCNELKTGAKKLESFLSSKERKKQYLGNDRLCSDFAMDTVPYRLRRTGKLDPSRQRTVVPILLGTYIGSRFYARSDYVADEQKIMMDYLASHLAKNDYRAPAQEHRIVLNNGTVACFTLEKMTNWVHQTVCARLTFMFKVFAKCFQEEYSMRFSSCEGEWKDKVLDLRKFLKKADESKIDSDFIIKIPYMRDVSLKNQDLFLPKGHQQLKPGTEVPSPFKPKVKTATSMVTVKPKVSVEGDKVTFEPASFQLPDLKTAEHVSSTQLGTAVKVTDRPRFDPKTTTLFETFELSHTTSTTTPKPKAKPKFGTTTREPKYVKPATDFSTSILAPLASAKYETSTIVSTTSTTTSTTPVPPTKKTKKKFSFLDVDFETK